MKSLIFALGLVFLLTGLVYAGSERPSLELRMDFDNQGEGSQNVENHLVKLVEGPFGKAGEFNGRNLGDGGSVVTLPETRGDSFFKSLGNGPFTVECWFKIDPDADDTGTYELVNAAGPYGPGWRMYYTWRSLVFLSGRGEKEIGGKPGFWAVGTNPLEFPVPLDRWHHLAAARDEAGSLTLYYDGAPAARSDGSFEISPGDGRVTLGAGAGYPLQGCMDDVRVYRGARSAEQILVASQGIDGRVAVQLDGKLDEAIWKGAKRFGDFKLNRGGAISEVQTEVLVAQDADNIYFGVTAHEPRMDQLVDAIHENSMRVYNDDSLEIMLAADGNQADYYHFLVNASGYRGQEMRGQSGNVGDRWENDIWFAETTKGRDRWVAEIAIPLAVLNREEQSMVESMRFNVVRNRRVASVANGHHESSLADGAINSGAKFIEYKLEGTNLSSWQLRSGVAKLADARLVDGTLAANITLPLRNLGSSDVALDVTAVMLAGSYYVRASAAAQLPARGSEQTVEFPFQLQEPGTYQLFLFARTTDGDSLVLADRREVDIAFVPMAIDVTRPIYRNTIYATETITDLAATVRIGLSAEAVGGATLEIALIDHAGKATAQTSIPNPRLEQSVTLPVKKLPEGTYTLTATLRQSDKELAKANETIRKLPKPPVGAEVRIDERQRLLINGEARLPIIWYTRTIDGIAETGADGVLADAESPGVLDDLHSRGLMAIVGLIDGSAHASFIRGKSELSTEGRQFIVEKVNRLKDHPAVLAWFIADEPEGTGDSPALLKQIHDIVAELDPYHPTSLINNTVRGLHTYAPAQEIFLPDPYILPVKGGGLERGMEYVVTFTQETAKAGRGRKVTGNTPQVFNYGDMGQFNGRAPTFVEQRCQQYISIIHGTRFFMYYNFSYMKGYPELEYGVPELMKEIRAITPVLLDGEALAGVSSSNPAIHLLALTYQGKEFILACNVEPKTILTKLTLPPNIEKLHVLSDTRAIERSGDRAMADTFEPYATHIYTSDPDFSSPISLTEIQSAIERSGGTFTVDYGHR